MEPYEVQVNRWLASVSLRTGSLLVGVRTPEGEFFSSIGEDLPVSPGRVIVEAQSLSKLFAAHLATDAVLRGELDLADPISAWLDVPVPSRNGLPIRVQHLLEHNSGLPRVPPGVSDRSRNPYARLTRRDVLAALSSASLVSTPGTSLLYSNFGFIVLGYLLENVTGKPYAELLQERLCGPLRLADTGATLTAEQRARRLPGHSANGRPAGDWTAPHGLATVGLQTTPADLLAFAAPVLEQNASSARAALELAMMPRTPADEGGNRQGLSWMLWDHLADRRTLAYMTGLTGGYSGFLGVSPELGMAVVTLSNRATATSEQVGVALARRIARQVRGLGPGLELFSDPLIRPAPAPPAWRRLGGRLPGAAGFGRRGT